MLDFKGFLIENILFSRRVIHIDANSYAHTSGILNSEQSFYHSCFIFSPKNFTFHANELTCLYCLTVFIVFEGPLFQDHELFNLFGKGLKTRWSDTGPSWPSCSSTGHVTVSEIIYDHFYLLSYLCVHHDMLLKKLRVIFLKVHQNAQNFSDK